VKLLANENIEAACVNWLRSLGHDVVWGVEIYQGFPDTRLLAIANRESRIVLTRDRGFGEARLRGTAHRTGRHLGAFEGAEPMGAARPPASPVARNRGQHARQLHRGDE